MGTFCKIGEEEALSGHVMCICEPRTMCETSEKLAALTGVLAKLFLFFFDD